MKLSGGNTRTRINQTKELFQFLMMFFEGYFKNIVDKIQSDLNMHKFKNPQISSRLHEYE